MRPVTDLQRTVAPFEVISEYEPAGDQPTAIADLTEPIQAGEKDVVLLGATVRASQRRRPGSSRSCSARPS